MRVLTIEEMLLTSGGGHKKCSSGKGKGHKGKGHGKGHKGKGRGKGSHCAPPPPVCGPVPPRGKASGCHGLRGR